MKCERWDPIAVVECVDLECKINTNMQIQNSDESHLYDCTIYSNRVCLIFFWEEKRFNVHGIYRIFGVR